MERHAFAPPVDLEPLVERFWTLKSDPGEVVRMPLLPPGVGAELLVHAGRPLRVRTGAGTADARPVHLMMPRARPLDFAPQSDADFIVARIRAGALRHFLPEVIGDSPEGLPDGFNLWGRNAATLQERISETANPGRRAALLGEWLRARRAEGRKALHVDDAAIDAAIAAVYGQPDGDLASARAAAGLGTRQFERRFKSATGQCPKAFQQLVRFYKLVRFETLAPGRSYLPRALDLGYFDQAHAIHESRQLTGLAPAQLLAGVASRTHFYNPARPKAA